MGCNDPRHKEEFLAWMTDRIEKAGESAMDPPWEFKAALTSGNPKDLRTEVWREWYDHMNQDWEEAAKAAGGLVSGRRRHPSSIMGNRQIIQSIGVSKVRRTRGQEMADAPKP